MRLPSSGYYWTSFTLPIPSNFSGDDIRLEARVKDSNSEGGISAYDTSLWIAGSGDGFTDKSAGAVLMGESWGQYWDGLYAVDSSIRQIPELIIPLNDWRTIVVETKNNVLSVYNDGVKIKELAYVGKVGMMKYISISFKGSGSVDYMKLYEKGNLIVEDNFDSPSSTSCKYGGVEKPKETVQISGQIKFGSQAGKGVTLSGEGLTEKCLTDATGQFNCKIQKGWTGVLTPASKGVSFSPARIRVANPLTDFVVNETPIGTTTDSFPLNGEKPKDWVKLKTDNATWEIETSSGAANDKTAYEGRFSFGSAKIGANQTAAIETTINVTQAVGYVEFARRVSSSENNGVLKFYIDGVLQKEWSGDVDWGTEQFVIIKAANVLDTTKYFAANTHKLRWEYTKNGAESKGEDKAWIDAVSYSSSVKIAAINCEGTTVGTVKLMNITNPTCDELQAYAIWLNINRPKRMTDAIVFNKAVDNLEKANEMLQGYIDVSGKIYSYGKWIFGSKNLGEFLLDMNSKIYGESGNYALKNYPIAKEIWGGANELFSQTVTAYIELAAGGKLTPALVYPYAIEKVSGSLVNLAAALTANDMAENINSFNLADDFLDEYYKGGSNLNAMANKYKVGLPCWDTKSVAGLDACLPYLVDDLANSKGYYNTLGGYIAEDYQTDKVVNSIKSAMAFNKIFFDVKNSYSKPKITAPQNIDITVKSVAKAGEMTTIPVTISNQGAGDLQFMGYKLSGENKALFRLSNVGTGACPRVFGVLASSKSCTFTVSFSLPKESVNSSFTKYATLEITTNDPNTPTLQIPISAMYTPTF